MKNNFDVDYDHDTAWLYVNGACVASLKAVGGYWSAAEIHQLLNLKTLEEAREFFACPW
jgi:hypothetical protein